MADNTARAADFEAHKATYEGFINIGKISIVSLLNVMVCLILFTYGGTAGSIFGTIMIFAILIAAAIGMAMGSRGWIPAAGLFVLSGLIAIITAA